MGRAQGPHGAMSPRPIGHRKQFFPWKRASTATQVQTSNVQTATTAGRANAGQNECAGIFAPRQNRRVPPRARAGSALARPRMPVCAARCDTVQAQRRGWVRHSRCSRQRGRPPRGAMVLSSGGEGTSALKFTSAVTLGCKVQSTSHWYVHAPQRARARACALSLVQERAVVSPAPHPSPPVNLSTMPRPATVAP